MPTNSSNNNVSGDYRLGKIEANTETIMATVVLIREEMGVFGKRISEVEKDVASIQAERTVLLADYKRFVERVDGELQKVQDRATVLEKINSTENGQRKGLTLSGHFVHAAITILLGIAAVMYGEHMPHSSAPSAPVGVSAPR